MQSSIASRGLPQQKSSVSEMEVVEWLNRPESYSSSQGQVQHIQTHISHVFLVANQAYKLKKRVHFDFLDFSTLAARKTDCEREVRLNQRLAGSVYEGTLAISKNAQGELQWGEAGEVVDWVVKMRKLPLDQALDQAISQHRVKAEDVDCLARHLTAFYQQAPPLTVSAADYVTTLMQHVQANYAELAAAEHVLNAALVKRIHTAQKLMLLLKPYEFMDRVCDGRLVEGHGDLRPEHIILGHQPVVFDCLEFNTKMRQLDVADELAFLWMECDYLGAENLGHWIWDAYCQAVGDKPPPKLVNFYKCYRACVRAKVAALRAVQCADAAFDAAQRESLEYLRLADLYAQKIAPPVVMVIRGTMGSGKSTLARALAEQMIAQRISTDELRSEVFGPSDMPAEYGQDLYQPAKRLALYHLMGQQADQFLEQGRSVILDGAFLTRELRDEAYRLAHRRGALWLEVQCVCPPEEQRLRIESRIQAGHDSSEARPELLQQQQQADEPAWPDQPPVIVDTTIAPQAQAEQVWAALDAALMMLGKKQPRCE